VHGIGQIAQLAAAGIGEEQRTRKWPRREEKMLKTRFTDFATDTAWLPRVSYGYLVSSEWGPIRTEDFVKEMPFILRDSRPSRRGRSSSRRRLVTDRRGGWCGPPLFSWWTAFFESSRLFLESETCTPPTNHPPVITHGIKPLTFSFK